jgi:AmmeMemoRadiSam system protein A
VEIDEDAVDRLRDLSQVSVMDAAHAQEHSLEVHLPFLQTCLSEFKLVPLVVGDASPADVAQVLQMLWGGEETLVVISSDLSHYHDYNMARQLDTATCRAIETLQLHRIGPQEACGCIPIRGLLKLASDRKFKVQLLDLRNSGDTAGPRDRVVGYAAFTVSAAPDTQRRHAQQLLAAARESIHRGLQSGAPLLPDADKFPDVLRRPSGVFVTLTLDGRLRGCIGSLEPLEPLIVGVGRHAFAAAFQDPRFPPLSAREFSGVSVSISILSAAEVLPFETETELIARLRPGVDGLIIERGERRSTFLPAVWETLPSASDFVLHLKRKAGIADSESPERAWRYTTDSVSE